MYAKHHNHTNNNNNAPNPTLLDIEDLHFQKLYPKINFAIPPNYNWNIPSSKNYSIPNNPIEFTKYQDSKSLIDYTYHGYYTKERQQNVHDPIIDYYKSIAINKLKAPAYLTLSPWIIFTAGPMGAGKTHTLTWLNNLNVFPLNAFLKISPDRIKKFLPEYSYYLNQDNNNHNVGRMLRTEVGYLCEIIIWEILYSQNKCIWFDTSLRHGEFFNEMISNIRNNYQKYNIGLIHIHCQEDIVFERAKKRAKITGRIVPESDIQESIDQVPISIKQIKSLVDCLIHIDNSYDSAFHQTPNLLQIQLNNKLNNKPIIVDNPSWNIFNDIWNGKLIKMMTDTTSKL